MECLDAVSGCAYFYNARTEQTCWEDPRPAHAAAGSAGAAESEWEELQDADSGYPYYYNTLTEETCWEDPRPAQQWSNVNPLHPLPGESGGAFSDVNPLHEQPGDGDSGGVGQQRGLASTPSLTAGGFALARCLDSQPLSGSRGGPQTKLAGDRARRAEEMRARLGVRAAPPKRLSSRESGPSRLLTVASMKRPRESLTSALRSRSSETKSATSAFSFSKTAGERGTGLGRLSALGVVAVVETGQSSERSQGDADAVSFTRVEDRSQLSLHSEQKSQISMFNGRPSEEAVL